MHSDSTQKTLKGIGQGDIFSPKHNLIIDKTIDEVPSMGPRYQIGRNKISIQVI